MGGDEPAGRAGTMNGEREHGVSCVRPAGEGGEDRDPLG